MPDGTKKRVRRRIIIVKVVKKPKGGDDEKSPIEEEPVQYEEVDIDEANPEDEKYDPKVLFYSITIKQTDLFLKLDIFYFSFNHKSFPLV